MPIEPGDAAVYHDGDGGEYRGFILRETLIGHYDVVFTTAEAFQQDSIKVAHNIPIEERADDPPTRCAVHHPTAEWANQLQL